MKYFKNRQPGSHLAFTTSHPSVLAPFRLYSENQTNKDTDSLCSSFKPPAFCRGAGRFQGPQEPQRQCGTRPRPNLPPLSPEFPQKPRVVLTGVGDAEALCPGVYGPPGVA